MAIYAGMNSQVACGSIGGRHHHHRCYRQQQNVSTSCSNGSERRNKQQQFLRCGVSGQNPLDSDQKRSRNRRNTNRITRCKSGESNNNDVTEDTGRFQSSSTRTSTTRVLLQSLLRMMPSPRDSSSQNVYNNSVPRETGDESTSVKTASPEQEELISGIAAFYDESSSLWESMWGEHMHHGYYDENDENVSEYSLDDHRKAQVLMIDKVLDWAKIDDDLNKPSGGQLQLLDVGCGIGGSSRHMVQRFSDSGNEWKGFGVTLSPNQAQRANSITRDCFASPVPLTYLVRDAVNLNTVVDANVEQSLASPSKITFEDNSFDLIWSMESAEHMKDKRALMKEMHRVCKPGGKIILVTWCHRSTEAEPLSTSEKDLLSSICDCYYLPQWCSMNDYVNICSEEEKLLFQDIRTADWSAKVAPFWTAVIKSAIQPKGLYNLVTKTGIKTLRGALVMPLMSEGFKCGLIKFNLMTGTKPLM